MPRIELLRGLRRLVELAAQMPQGSVMNANQNVAIPAGLFATVWLNNGVSIGVDELHYSNQDDGVTLDETVEGERVYLSSLNFFREGAIDTANRFVTRLRMSNAITLMQQRNIGLVRVSEVRDLTAVVDGNQEERAQLDLIFNSTTSEVSAVDSYGEFPFILHTETEQFELTVKEP